MYQDYLKPIYREEYKTYNHFANNSLLKQKQQYIKKQKVKRKSKHNSFANNILKTKQHTASIKKDMKQLNSQSAIISKGVSGLLSNIIPILAMITLAGLALFGVSKYLKSKEDYDSDYTNDDNNGEFSGLSTGHISEEGKNQIKKDEGGFKEKAYWDKNGYSIGYGHHGLVDGKPIYEGQTISKEKAEQLFNEDILKAENRVKSQLKEKGITAPISQNQFDAMVNYTYNAGQLGDKFLENLKQGDYLNAAKELEVGKENLDRMARIRENFLSDVNSDNTLKQNVENLNQSTPYPIAQTGGEIGSHKLKSDKVQVSDIAKEYLQNINSDDIITSGMEGKRG